MQSRSSNFVYGMIDTNNPKGLQRYILCPSNITLLDPYQCCTNKSVSLNSQQSSSPLLLCAIKFALLCPLDECLKFPHHRCQHAPKRRKTLDIAFHGHKVLQESTFYSLPPLSKYPPYTNQTPFKNLASQSHFLTKNTDPHPCLQTQ